MVCLVIPATCHWRRVNAISLMRDSSNSWASISCLMVITTINGRTMVLTSTSFLILPLSFRLRGRRPNWMELVRDLTGLTIKVFRHSLSLDIRAPVISHLKAGDYSSIPTCLQVYSGSITTRPFSKQRRYSINSNSGNALLLTWLLPGVTIVAWWRVRYLTLLLL